MRRRPRPPTGLMLDLYHLDSAYVSWRSARNGTATFELYTRSHPFGSAFLLVAGLETALEYVRAFRFTDDDIAYIRRCKHYDPAFLDELRALRFTGEVHAIPEGTIAFGNEPLLRLTAPFREALLMESILLQVTSVSTLIATKAARVVEAAAGRPVAEFGFRRAQHPFLAARSAYIGGCAATSFVAAAEAYEIPATGTIPHALIEAFAHERDAFEAVASSIDGYSLLLDTYDVRRAIHVAAQVATAELARTGHRLAAVRLDSGDLAADARYCREVLDAAGLQEVRILASGELDEFRIEELVRTGAPIEGFGVGTAIASGAGSVEHRLPGGALGVAYKLAWYEDGETIAPIKLAGEKSTWPGRKQVYRVGAYDEDVVQLEDEPAPSNAVPLLELAMKEGDVIPGVLPPLEEVRERALREREALPERYRALLGAPAYPVRRSAGVERLREEAVRSRP